MFLLSEPFNIDAALKASFSCKTMHFLQLHFPQNIRWCVKSNDLHISNLNILFTIEHRTNVSAVKM